MRGSSVLEPVDRRAFLRRAGRSTLGFTLAAPAAGLLSACGGGSSSAANGRFTTTAAYVSYPVQEMSVPVIAALENGFFAAHGVHANVDTIVSSAALSRELTQGQLGFGGGSVISTMVGFGAGFTNFQLIGYMERVNALVWGVKQDSKIHTPADLRGASIGNVGGVKNDTVYYVEQMLAQANLVLSDVKLVEFNSIPDAQNAMLNGVVDVTFMIRPAAAPLQADGKVRIIWDGYKELPGIPYVGLYANRKVIKSDPKGVQSYVDATAQAMQWVHRNRVKAIELWSKKIGTPPNVLEQYALTPDFVSAAYDIRVSRELFENDKKVGVDLTAVPASLTFEDFAVAEFSLNAYEKYPLV